MRACCGALLVAVGCRAPTLVPAPIANVPPAATATTAAMAAPSMYAAVFRSGARYQYAVVHAEVSDDTGDTMECVVSDVHRTPNAIDARLTCRDGEGAELPSVAGWPSGSYVATADGLFSADGVAPPPERIMMTPHGEARAVLAARNHRIEIAPDDLGETCRVETSGINTDDERQREICFRPGAGIVRGRLVGGLVPGRTASRYQLTGVRLAGWPDEGPPPAAPALAPTVVINEIAAAGDPDDWFEIVNLSSRPVQLDELVFVDHADDFARVVGFPTATLAPGAHHQQPVSDQRNGFRLRSDEELTIYRAADLARVDRVDWDEGAAPVDGSFARIPDATGGFTTVTTPTPGQPNR